MLGVSLKIIAIITFTFLNFTFAYSQENKIAKVKFELTNFKKPSYWAGYFGLLKFSPNNKFLVISGEDRDIDVYDVESGKLKSKIVSDPKVFFNAFSFAPDGKTALVRKGNTQSLMLFDLETGNSLREISSTEKADRGNVVIPSEGGLQMSETPVSPDWQNVLIALNTGEYELIDFASGKSKFTLNHAEKTNRLKDGFKMFGSLLTTGVAWFTVRHSIFSPDGKFVVISNGNETPTLWDVESGKQIANLEPQDNRVYFSVFTPDSQSVITFNNDGIFSTWEAKTGKQIFSFDIKEKKSTPRAISRDYQQIVTAHVLLKNKDAKIWNVRNGTLVATLEKCQPTGVIFSPDGKLIASVPFNQKQLAQIWDAETGKLLVSIPRKKEENTLDFDWTPDSKFLITSSKDNVKIWNPKGELIQILENAKYPIALSQDGTFLATGGNKNSGYVWELGK